MKRMPVVMKLSGVVRHRRADEPEPLPRILTVEADCHRHVRARREVGGVEPDALHRRSDLDDVVRGQPVALQRLWLPSRVVVSTTSTRRVRVDVVSSARTRKSGAPCSTSSCVLRADLHDRPGDARGDRAHHLHHLDQAHGRVGLDARPDVHERRRPRRLGAVERPEHRSRDRESRRPSTRAAAPRSRPPAPERAPARDGRQRPRERRAARARRSRCEAPRGPTRRSAGGSRGCRPRSAACARLRIASSAPQRRRTCP